MYCSLGFPFSLSLCISLSPLYNTCSIGVGLSKWVDIYTISFVVYDTNLYLKTPSDTKCKWLGDSLLTGHNLSLQGEEARECKEGWEPQPWKNQQKKQDQNQRLCLNLPKTRRDWSFDFSFFKSMAFRKRCFKRLCYFFGEELRKIKHLDRHTLGLRASREIIFLDFSVCKCMCWARWPTKGNRCLFFCWKLEWFFFPPKIHDFSGVSHGFPRLPEATSHVKRGEPSSFSMAVPTWKPDSWITPQKLTWRSLENPPWMSRCIFLIEPWGF